MGGWMDENRDVCYSVQPVFNGGREVDTPKDFSCVRV